MSVTLLIESIMGLVSLLAILLFFFFYIPKKRKKTPATPEATQPTQVKQTPTDLDYLRGIIKDKNSSTKQLQETLELILKHHGEITPKMGLRPHPDFDIYMDILFTICRHPHTNKDIIIKFDAALERKNPSYVKEINDAITKGLNSRGV